VIIKVQIDMSFISLAMGPNASYGFLILDSRSRITTLPNEWSARRRDLYLKTHNTPNREITIPQVGFEPAIPARERPQTHALDRAIKIHTKIIFVFQCFTVHFSIQ